MNRLFCYWLNPTDTFNSRSPLWDLLSVKLPFEIQYFWLHIWAHLLISYVPLCRNYFTSNGDMDCPHYRLSLVNPQETFCKFCCSSVIAKCRKYTVTPTPRSRTNKGKKHIESVLPKTRKGRNYVCGCEDCKSDWRIVSLPAMAWILGWQKEG